MVDKNMTDNEIIKALEEELKTALIINHRFEESNNTESPDDHRFIALLSRTIKLINRQKAEIERLNIVKNHIDILIHRGVEYPTAETYNEAFKKALERLYDNTNAKAEAYKEFAENAKEKLCDIGTFEFCGGNYYLIGVAFFDNLLKEMVGEGE